MITPHCGIIILDKNEPDRPGLIGGGEAADIINDAVISGQLLCALMARRGVIEEHLVRYKDLNVNYHEIDRKRRYRIVDVNNCAQTIIVAITFAPGCAYLAYKRGLKPVGRLTGF